MALVAPVAIAHIEPVRYHTVCIVQVEEKQLHVYDFMGCYFLYFVLLILVGGLSVLCVRLLVPSFARTRTSHTGVRLDNRCVRWRDMHCMLLLCGGRPNLTFLKHIAIDRAAL